MYLIVEDQEYVYNALRSNLFYSRQEPHNWQTSNDDEKWILDHNEIKWLVWAFKITLTQTELILDSKQQSKNPNQYMNHKLLSLWPDV